MFSWFPTQQAQERIGKHCTSLNQLVLEHAVLRRWLEALSQTLGINQLHLYQRVLLILPLSTACVLCNFIYHAHLLFSVQYWKGGNVSWDKTKGLFLSFNERNSFGAHNVITKIYNSLSDCLPTNSPFVCLPASLNWYAQHNTIHCLTAVTRQQAVICMLVHLQHDKYIHAYSSCASDKPFSLSQNSFTFCRVLGFIPIIVHWG